MKANELRIGNWVLAFGEYQWDIDGIRRQSVFKKQGNCPLSALEPIPLTEEWLVKFGFEFRKCGQDINSGRFCHWDYWIYKGLILRSSKNRFGFNGDVKAIDIKSVHQLQNLYFALTGEELEIK